MDKQKTSIISNIYDRKNAELVLEPPFPHKHLTIECSNICNHRCVFCTNHKMTRKLRYIDEELLYRVLCEAYDLGSREVALMLHGEPFVSKNMADYIKYAKDLGYTYVYLSTNGALATPERLESVFTAGLDSIKFSINAGNRESYLKIHGKDDFLNVIANVKWCHNYRKTQKRLFNLLCSFVVTTETLPEVPLFRREYSEIFDEIAFYKCLNRGGIMPEVNHLIPDIEGPNRTNSCALAFSSVYITCEGYLSPCSMDANLDLLVGDVNKTSLQDAWYGERMKAFRQKIIDVGEEGNPEKLPAQCKLCYQNEGIMPIILDI